MHSDSNVRVIRSPFLTDEERQELEGAPVLDPETLDAAIIGSLVNAFSQRVLVYSHDKLVDVFTEEFRNDPDAEESDGEEYESTPDFKRREWVDYNTVRALPYCGSRAPVVLEALQGGEDGAEDLAPSELVEFRGQKWLRQA